VGRGGGSSVTVNLAPRSPPGQKVGVLDADIHGHRCPACSA
jgi:Mrp family chromosome partitioning ATPase